MFYIKTFYKVLFSKPLSALLWTCGLAIMVASFTGKDWLGQTLTFKNSGHNPNPYFFALMPKKVNSGYVKRKLLDLPGVERVNIMAQKNIIGHVKSVLESTNIEWDKDMLDLNYSGLKVFLSPDLRGNSQKLIRNYLTRIAGERDVTLGALKRPAKKESQVKFGEIFSYTLSYLPLLGVILLCLSLFTVRKALGRESFIIETYQRRDQVFEKGMMYAQAPLLCLLCLYAYFNGMAGVIGLGLFSLGLVTVLGLAKSSKQWS